VGSDGDVMAAQLVRPALRLLSGQAVCMAASYCPCMTWRFIPPHASVAMLTPCVWAHVLVGAEISRAERRLLVAETCRARRRLLVAGTSRARRTLVVAETCRARRRLVVGVPLVGKLSEMQPTGQRLDVLPVWVLTRIFSPPCPESLS
jgi:hypothetical protein